MRFKKSRKLSKRSGKKSKKLSKRCSKRCSKKCSKKCGKKSRKLSKRMRLKGGWVNNINENNTKSYKDKLLYYFNTGYKTYPYFKLPSLDNNKVYKIDDYNITINDVTLRAKNPESENIVFKFNDPPIDLTVADGSDFNQWDWGKKEDYNFNNFPITSQNVPVLPSTTSSTPNNNLLMNQNEEKELEENIKGKLGLDESDTINPIILKKEIDDLKSKRIESNKQYNEFLLKQKKDFENFCEEKGYDYLYVVSIIPENAKFYEVNLNSMFISDMKIKNKKYKPLSGNFYGYIITDEEINSNTLSSEEKKTMHSIVNRTTVPSDDDTSTADFEEAYNSNLIAGEDKSEKRFAKIKNMFDLSKNVEKP